MNTAWRTPQRDTPPRGGFTLIELLVSMVIFVTVMTGVTLLFSRAIRTTKQGYLNQDAFEIARGAMDVLERDLSRSFTSRDHGDVFNFYGTPIGFTFVGMVSADGSSRHNLARVTYVVYHVPTSAENIAGAVSIYENVDGLEISTYSLLRYIEPGQEDLESFPLDWIAPISDRPQTPRLQTLIGDPEADYPEISGGAVAQAIFDGACDSLDIPCLKEVEKAKKRELWIRMLSGGDDEVPSAWGQGGIFANLDPFDYAIAENFRHLAILDSGGTIVDDPFFPRVVYEDTANFDPDESRVPFFTYREFGTRIRKDANDEPIPRLDPFTGFPLFADPPYNSIPLFEKEVAPIELRYWNDTRNVLYMQVRENEILTDGIDNDGDGLVDAIGLDLQEGTEDDDLDEADGINLGSPLDARAPVEISVNFTLFFPSPSAGAPDFNRKFTMSIDLPTGYRRTLETPVAPRALAAPSP